MKRLKFAEPLPGLVLARTKDTTWRIKDDKDLQKNDILSLQNANGEEFETARIIWIRETTFAHLTQEDTEGHEKFETEQEMLETYSRYYNIPVTRQTPLKVVKFELSQKAITEDTIKKIIENDSWMMGILSAATKLNLPDWWIGAGFVRNKIWDVLHGYTKRTPLHDVDVIYLDKTDTVEKKEKEYEQQLNQLIPDIPWSVKNQARMHTKHNDIPYTSTTQALSYWVETATCMGVRLDTNGKLELTAPHGTQDLFNLILRPSPRIYEQKKLKVFYDRIKKKEWQNIWPKLRIEA